MTTPIDARVSARDVVRHGEGEGEGDDVRVDDDVRDDDDASTTCGEVGDARDDAMRCDRVGEAPLGDTRDAGVAMDDYRRRRGWRGVRTRGE